MVDIQTQLQQTFPELVFQANFPLAPLTTVKIGGPAELFCEISSQKQFIRLISYCKKQHIPLTLLGWGANTLIADAGIKGLVVKYNSTEISIHDKESTQAPISTLHSRWQKGDDENTYPTFDTVEYSEVNLPRVPVQIAAGVPLAYAIQHLLQHNITGLQWFSRIPATIGGAVYNNIHGGTHLLSEYVLAVDIIDQDGNQKTLSAIELEFEYDYSRFHHTDEVIVSVELSLFKGDAQKAKTAVVAWAKQKKDQPQNSLGCIFQNISQKQQSQLGYPTPSVGYIIDNILHKKGFRIGDAVVSQKHAAFIENAGKATASDYLQVIKTLVLEIKEKTGLTVQPEIFFKGFTQQELQFLHSNQQKGE